MAGEEATTVTVSGRLIAAFDAMDDSYIDWREDAAAVADGYRRWVAALPAEQQRRFTAYVATLDQEEAAAARYAALVRDAGRVLRRSTPPRSAR
jgi:hypothetical protein